MPHRYFTLFADDPVKTRTFPRPIEPSPEEGGIGWKLRYAPDSLTREDQLYLASIVSAYRHLVCNMSVRDRQDVVSEMRRIMEAQFVETRLLEKQRPPVTTETPDCQSAAHATIAAALLTSTLINSPVSNALAAAHVASEILAALNGVGLGPGHETAACVAVANAEPAPPKSAPASPWQDAADHAAGRLTAAEQASGPENIIALLRARLQL